MEYLPLISYLITVKMACGENPKYVNTSEELMIRRVYGNAINWPGGPNSGTHFFLLLIT